MNLHEVHGRISVIMELNCQGIAPPQAAHTLGWKNHLVLGTEFDLGISFLYFILRLVLSSPEFIRHRNMLTSQSIFLVARGKYISQSVLFPYIAKGPEPHLVLFSNSKITGHLLWTLLQLFFIFCISVNHILIYSRWQSSSLEAIQLETVVISQTADWEPPLQAPKHELPCFQRFCQYKNPPQKPYRTKCSTSV